MLRVSKLCKSFGGVKALDDVSFDLEKGETLAVIGPSGGGKSTLLRVLNGLEAPDGGSIEFTDRETGQKKGTFGLVFQEYNLFPQYTVLGNLTLAPRLLGKNYSQAGEILEKLGLSEKKDNYPSQLSGGQKQRTAIARALMLKPDILCFDEPTSALDPKLTEEIVNIINRMKGEQTIIIVTHDMEVMRGTADKTAVMDNGKLKYQ
ncbi:MAG: ATP-binding cassette domain-containing protein [Oscillospiraceae bacterium]|nr:ATP-binding cassette domain-containing protein [Oscillospiraceae bacterium]